MTCHDCYKLHMLLILSDRVLTVYFVLWLGVGQHGKSRQVGVLNALADVPNVILRLGRKELIIIIRKIPTRSGSQMVQNPSGHFCGR